MSSPASPAPGKALAMRTAVTATALVLCIVGCKLLVHLYAGGTMVISLMNSTTWLAAGTSIGVTSTSLR